MANKRYFQLYFKETDKIQEYNEVKEVTINGTLHILEYNLTKEDILKIILSLNEELRQKIRNTFIQIDFKNGDINHYINYLMKGYTEILTQEQIKEIQKTELKKWKILK